MGDLALPEPVHPGLWPVVLGAFRLDGRLVLAVAPRAAATLVVEPFLARFADHAWIITVRSADVTACPRPKSPNPVLYAVRMAVAMDELITDLRAETGDLERLLGPEVWDVPTPAEGWTVRDQITHLAWFDDAAVRAATAPEAFQAGVGAMIAEGLDTDLLVKERRSMPGEEVLTWFRAARRRMIDVLAGLDPKARIPWYGPEMGVASFTTARLMETWAHGQDVADGLGAGREPSDRLRHIAQIGVRALPWSFTVHGRPVPAEPVRVELTLPGGALWTAGPVGAADVVRGAVLDFCLVVTQRRHPADIDLVVSGPVAGEWMEIAQAFAGPPGTGRRPGQFA
jgi:uncharacterized protein (TIGR03084 family)